MHPYADIPFEFPFDRYQEHHLVIWGQRERIAKGDMEGDSVKTSSDMAFATSCHEAHSECECVCLYAMWADAI
jgi:hypothetical protein